MRERDRWTDLGGTGEGDEGREKEEEDINSVRNEKGKINTEYMYFKI